MSCYVLYIMEQSWCSVGRLWLGMSRLKLNRELRFAIRLCGHKLRVIICDFGPRRKVYVVSARYTTGRIGVSRRLSHHKRSYESSRLESFLGSSRLTQYTNLFPQGTHTTSPRLRRRRGLCAGGYLEKSYMAGERDSEPSDHPPLFRYSGTQTLAQ